MGKTVSSAPQGAGPKTDAIYDATKLGAGKMIVLGLQHMFAMFGATVLVPALTGLSVSATLLFAGLGTLLFHLLTKRKVPAFLGSSFAFLAGYFSIAGLEVEGMTKEQFRDAVIHRRLQFRIAQRDRHAVQVPGGIQSVGKRDLPI